MIVIPSPLYYYSLYYSSYYSPTLPTPFPTLTTYPIYLYTNYQLQYPNISKPITIYFVNFSIYSFVISFSKCFVSKFVVVIVSIRQLQLFWYLLLLVVGLLQLLVGDCWCCCCCNYVCGGYYYCTVGDNFIVVFDISV